MNVSLNRKKKLLLTISGLVIAVLFFIVCSDSDYYCDYAESGTIFSLP